MTIANVCPWCGGMGGCICHTWPDRPLSPDPRSVQSAPHGMYAQGWKDGWKDGWVAAVEMLKKEG